MNKQEIEKAIEVIKKFKYFADLVETPEEYFRHMQGHTKELSLVLNIFDMANLCDDLVNSLEYQQTNGWIPVSEKLPEENIDNITNDFLEYNVSLKFEYAECTRTYKFGAGKWWNNGTDMTEYVIAWQPLPEPYTDTIN